MGKQRESRDIQHADTVVYFGGGTKRNQLCEEDRSVEDADGEK